MGFLNYFERLFGKEQNQSMNLLQNTLYTMRRYKSARQYEKALVELERISELLQDVANKTLIVMTKLHRADIYIAQGRWEDANNLLSKLKHMSEINNQPIHLAYTYVAMGTLYQAQNEWQTSRLYYEKAIKLARKAGALGAEGRAQGHLADTYLQDGNASFAVYLLREAIPKLNKSGDTELGGYFVGRLGEAELIINNQQEGLHLVGRALRLAQQMGNIQHEVRWRRILVQMSMKSGSYAEARNHLLSITQIVEPASDDHIFALCYLSKVALHFGQYDEMKEFAQNAVDIVQSFEQDSEIYRQVYLTLGMALQFVGKSQEAVTYLKIALASTKIVNTPYSHVDVLRNLAAAYAENGKTDTALEVYNHALDYAENFLAAKGKIHRDIGIMFLQQGDFEKASQSWRIALHEYEECQQYTQIAQVYCDLANLYKHQGQTRRAMKNYSQALMVLSSVDDERVRGMVLAGAGTAYVDQGDIETAEAFLIESMQIAKRLNDYPSEVTRRGNYGWFLLSTGRATQALDVLRDALQQSQKLNLSLQLAVQTDNIGLAHDELRQFEEALVFHQKALNLLGADYVKWRGVFMANKGHTLLSLGDVEEAILCLDTALNIGRTINNTEIVVRALTGLIKAGFHQNGDVAEREVVEEIVKLSKKTGLRRLLADSLMLRSEYYARTGEQDLAVIDWVNASKILGILRIVTDERFPTWLELDRLEQ